MSVSDLPCDVKPHSDPRAEQRAYQALFRAVQHFGSAPQDREATSILIQHWAIQLGIEVNGLRPSASVCFESLRGAR